MKIGIFKSSLKMNERRVPIYPEHLPQFPKSLRCKMVFENGYGSDYGYDDNYFISLGTTLSQREELFLKCDLLVLQNRCRMIWPT